jgi:hypothetical protein
VGAELRARTGGRGPDVCIEAVGMEAHDTGPQHVYGQVKPQLRLHTDRPAALREAIYACRKGGSVFVLGVFGGAVDKFPLGAISSGPSREDARLPAVGVRAQAYARWPAGTGVPRVRAFAGPVRH